MGERETILFNGIKAYSFGMFHMELGTRCTAGSGFHQLHMVQTEMLASIFCLDHVIHEFTTLIQTDYMAFK